MFHMLSCFNLKPGVTVNQFKESLNLFESDMHKLDLIESVNPLGKRQHHPVMDTDSERAQEYYFTITFRDRQQCDQAVEKIYAHTDPGEESHNNMYSKIIDSIFICWEDV